MSEINEECLDIILAKICQICENKEELENNINGEELECDSASEPTHECHIKCAVTGQFWNVHRRKVHLQNKEYTFKCWKLRSRSDLNKLVYIFGTLGNKYITLTKIGNKTSFRLLTSNVSPETIDIENNKEKLDARAFYYKQAPLSSSGYLECAMDERLVATIKKNWLGGSVIPDTEPSKWFVNFK